MQHRSFFNYSVIDFISLKWLDLAEVDLNLIFVEKKRLYEVRLDEMASVLFLTYTETCRNSLSRHAFLESLKNKNKKVNNPGHEILYKNMPTVAR